MVHVTCSVVGGPLDGETSQYSPPEGETTAAEGGALSRTVRVAGVEVIVGEGGVVPCSRQPGPPTTTW
jgi:hypothetical protein